MLHICIYEFGDFNCTNYPFIHNAKGHEVIYYATKDYNALKMRLV